MPDVSFIVPVAPYHTTLLERALSSVDAQTVPCETVVIHDTDQRGAGYARNRGLAQVTTPLVVFLDADDWVEPTFVEDCLDAYDGHSYVYTDWWRWQYDEAIADWRSLITEAPACPWKGDGAWHVITTLLPTERVRQLGGFDEALPGFEDTDFYWKLTRNGLCGRRLAKPLFHYGREGQRAQAFYHRPDRGEIAQSVVLRYRGKRMPEECGGCGGSPYLAPDYPEVPLGEQLAGDVLAAALWGGNQSQRGRISGRLYPRTGNGKQLWVDPRDLHAMPQHFEAVVAGQPTQSADDFARWARKALNVQPNRTPAIPTQPDAMPAPPQGGQADVGAVLRLYQQQ